MRKRNNKRLSAVPRFLKRKKKWLLPALAAILALCACGGREELSLPVTYAEEVIVYPAPTMDPALRSVRISELMTRNPGTILDEDGDCPDWLELCNEGETAVNLSGCRLLLEGEKTGEWTLGELTLPAGEQRLIFASGKNRFDGEGELHASFKLRRQAGILRLLSPEGVELDAVAWSEPLSDGCSLCRNAAGESVSGLPTPGYPNTEEGYRLLQSASAPKSPLILSEAMNANETLLPQKDRGCCDWVELRNVSEEEIELSDYYLSDDPKEPRKSPLPRQTLAAGAYTVVFLDGSGTDGFGSFSLDAGGEGIFLSDGDCFVDAFYLPRTSVDGSYGRSDGLGLRCYALPTPGEANGSGALRLSEKPSVSLSGGVYNESESLTVELFGSGAIYYTLDGSLPTEESTRYTRPLQLSRTTTLRAVQIEADCLPSRALTESYLLREELTLPALCLSTDDPFGFDYAYKSVDKDAEISGNISFYEENGSFSKDCDISLAGNSSLELYAKKGLRVHFRDRYDGKLLEYDVFGEEIQEFSSLTVRAGGLDVFTNVFRPELWQDLAAEKFESVLSMYSRYCILYVNGEYYGIYALKEDYSKQYYASHAGVSKDSVEWVKFPAGRDSSFWAEVYEYCMKEDLTTEESYAYLAERIDMDSLTDWFLLEGVSGNIDLFNNLKLVRSSEGDGKWHFAFYDLDRTLEQPIHPFAAFFGYVEYPPYQMRQIMRGLCSNPIYREKMLRRYGEIWNTTLSNEELLRRIDGYEELLRGEMTRNNLRWRNGDSDAVWLRHNEIMRQVITDNDWQTNAVLKLCGYIGVSAEERMEYFGF